MVEHFIRRNGTRRAVAPDHHPGFGPAVAGAIRLRLTGGCCAAAKQRRVGGVAVVVDNLSRPGGEIGLQRSGLGDRAGRIESIGRDVVDHRLQVAPATVDAGRVDASALGDHRYGDTLASLFLDQFFDRRLDRIQHRGTAAPWALLDGVRVHARILTQL